MPDNFDFGGHIEDHADVAPRDFNSNDVFSLSPYGALVAAVGYRRGKETYDSLVRIASTVAKQHGGVPGIMFDVDGGRFVSIRERNDDAL